MLLSALVVVLVGMEEVVVVVVVVASVSLKLPVFEWPPHFLYIYLPKLPSSCLYPYLFSSLLNVAICLCLTLLC